MVMLGWPVDTEVDTIVDAHALAYLRCFLTKLGANA